MNSFAGISEFGYIGPGAGIALAGSFLIVLVAIASAMLVLFTWPLKWLRRTLRNRHALSRARFRRVVVLGLDGLDPVLAEQLLDEGLLPNLARLKDAGCYHRLGTTWPPLSPVAWSSFSTGANPGKHRIFDFVSRNPQTMLPEISSVRIRPPRRTLKLGRYVVPLSRPRIESLRRSKPFWQVLGEAGIFSNILRVPITFPPDRFHGVQLSAMCVPDLRGTQGTFTWFTEQGEAGRTGDAHEGGLRVTVTRQDGVIHGELPGPANLLRSDSADSRLSFTVTPQKNGNGSASLKIGGQSVALKPGHFTDWIRLSFPLAPGIRAHGLCRFRLKQTGPPFEMSCTPIHIDPDRPVMPVSHPRVYSMYLAKSQGPYATMGLAEDTWSLSEGVIDEPAFLQQVWDINEERKRMFADALQRTRRGAVVCVFDGPDRIQHMFWRFQDPQHPGYDKDDPHADRFRSVIRDMYVRMDELVGTTLDAAGQDTALIVMSDHGFKPFRRGVDLNAWLMSRGLLFLKDNATSSSGAWLKDVDWSRTKAYAIGLAGIYINQRGRESQGNVADGAERLELIDRLCRELSGLRDPGTGDEAIFQAIPREQVYRGPYVNDSADIIVGYRPGFRVSWDAASGKCGTRIFSDNLNAWSGDHCIHPQLVPGVLFSNVPLNGTAAPQITDIAPTVLELLGVAAPAWMDGQSLICDDGISQN